MGWTSAVHGRQIVGASLHVHMSQGALYVADVCTIAALGWPEGTGTGRSPAAANESSYDWMRAPGATDTPGASNYWSGYAGSRLVDVTFGNGGSICSYAHHTNISRDADGWTTLDIAPELVEAMVLDQDGLILCDSSQLHNNTAVNTRSQSHSKPYLLVDVVDDAGSALFNPAPQVSGRYNRTRLPGTTNSLVTVKSNLTVLAIGKWLCGDDNWPVEWRCCSTVATASTWEHVRL